MEIELTRMSQRGQIVIPQQIRTEQGLQEGEKFLVCDINEIIVLKPLRTVASAKSIAEFEKAFASTQKTAKERGIMAEDVDKEIKAYRDENA